VQRFSTKLTEILVILWIFKDIFKSIMDNKLDKYLRTMCGYFLESLVKKLLDV